MNQPQISVIMPAYNAEDYIQESIESILNQTYSDFELIILDDASTDNTLIKASQYKDPRIRIYKNAENLYIPANRNRGIELARGKYIVWQDADDISTPDRVEKLYNHMQNDPKIGICGSFLEIFSAAGVSHIRQYSTTDAEIRSTIFRYSPVAQPAAIIRKECFNKVGKYNLNIPVAEDLEMSFRIGQYYKFANIPYPLIRYRVHDRSATFIKLRFIEDNTLRTRKLFKENSAYSFTHYDNIYNILQKVTLHLMPSQFRIFLFNFIRRFNLI